MNNKRVIIISCVLIIFILLFFLFYLLVIKPVIIGEYIPSEKECTKAYKCDCLKDTCICTFKKWFWENKIQCKRSNIKDVQLNK